MKWLVVINTEGVQGQVPVGKGDLKKAAEEQKALKNRVKIMYAFEFAKDPDGDYQDRKSFEDYYKVHTARLHKKYGAASPQEIAGYNLRKQVAMGDGIEVQAELDADDYDEFRKKYGGTKGAIDILLSTEKVMSGAGKDPAKAVSKLIRKLEIEAEDEED
jgi:hypothetical protein